MTPRGCWVLVSLNLVLAILTYQQSFHVQFVQKTNLYTSVRSLKYSNRIKLPSIPDHSSPVVDDAKDGTSFNNNNNDNSHQQPPKKSPYAYAFLVAACNPTNAHYRGFLYNILVSAYILQQSGSQADVLVLIQMDHGSSTHKLPPSEEALLHAIPNIRLHYLPLPNTPQTSFFQVNLQKFHVLKFTSYDRILYLDSDLMPFCNLDYLFHLSSITGYLKRNFVLATYGEPANGGFWMVAPQEGDFEKLQQIVVDTAQRTVAAEGQFNTTVGWGHILDYHTDPARVTTGEPRYDKWEWYGANADQGLLYYWMKYHQQDVSIAIGSTVENWGPAQQPIINTNESIDNMIISSSANHTAQPKTRAHLEKTMVDGLKNFTCLPPGIHPHKPGHFAHSITQRFNTSAWTPYRDVRHFWCDLKPWLQLTVTDDIHQVLEQKRRIIDNSDSSSNATNSTNKNNTTISNNDNTTTRKDNHKSPYDATDAAEFWWLMLGQVVEVYDLKLPPVERRQPPAMGKRIPRVQYRGTNQYMLQEMQLYLKEVNATRRKMQSRNQSQKEFYHDEALKKA